MRPLWHFIYLSASIILGIPGIAGD